MSGTPSAKKPSGTLNFVLDFGPLFLFFVASKFGSSDTDPKPQTRQDFAYAKINRRAGRIFWGTDDLVP